MRTRAALVGAAAVAALLTGCGPGAATTGAGPTATANPHLDALTIRQPASAADVARAVAAGWVATRAAAINTPIEFRSVDYAASIFNPGDPSGFTAFITTRRTVLVTPASAALVEAVNDGPARFATPADQTLWRAASSPSLGQAPDSAQRRAIPAGQYSFLPQGTTLTYQQAVALPRDPDRLAAVIRDHLRPAAGAHPPPALELRQLGYLVATAALTNPARAAAWQAVAALPGLHACPSPLNPIRPQATDLCIDSPVDETQISVDTGTGAIIAVADRLLQPSPAYPHVAAGTVVESSTFGTA